MTPDPRRRRVVIGVDTHKYMHVAVALDVIGGVIDSQSFAADSGGYEQLITWALSLGLKLTFAIEGTGSYGAGLTSAVRRRGVGTVEVMRTDRRDRRLRGKSDTLDAENAARAVLSGNATAIPKTNDGTVEMIRQVKIAKDLAGSGTRKGGPAQPVNMRGRQEGLAHAPLPRGSQPTRAGGRRSVPPASAFHVHPVDMEIGHSARALSQHDDTAPLDPLVPLIGHNQPPALGSRTPLPGGETTKEERREAGLGGLRWHKRGMRVVPLLGRNRWPTRPATLLRGQPDNRPLERKRAGEFHHARDPPTPRRRRLAQVRSYESYSVVRRRAARGRLRGVGWWWRRRPGRGRR